MYQFRAQTLSADYADYTDFFELRQHFPVGLENLCNLRNLRITPSYFPNS